MFPIKGIVPVGVLVSLLVGVGGLEPLELRLFDEMVQQSPPAPPSQRIVIVGITEADIQELDHYPISDRVLAQVLSQILALNPAVVGLGLFRDVPVRYEGDGEAGEAGEAGGAGEAGEAGGDGGDGEAGEAGGDGEKLTLEPREGSIVGADLAILVGAGLATQFRHSPITSQQNPPSPPITYPQNPPLFPPQASKPPQSLIPNRGSQWVGMGLTNNNCLLVAQVNQKTQHLEEALIQLQTTQNQLIQQEKLTAMSSLVGNLSHELKNPLWALGNRLEILTHIPHFKV